jgi:hypothetical protein
MDSIILFLRRALLKFLAVLTLSILINISLIYPSNATSTNFLLKSEFLVSQREVLDDSVVLSEALKSRDVEFSHKQKAFNKETKCVDPPWNWLPPFPPQCPVKKKIGRDDSTRPKGRQGWCSNFNLVELRPIVEEPIVRDSKTSFSTPSQFIEFTTGKALTLWFYIPEIEDFRKKKTIPSIDYSELILLREDGTEVKAILKLPKQRGITRFTFPPELAARVRVEKPEHWIFSVICDPRRPSRNPSVSGWIQKADLSNLSDLYSRLNDSKIDEIQKLQVYAENRLWYETLNSLISLHCKSPNDKVGDESWLAVLGWLKELGINERNIGSSFCNSEQSLQLVSISEKLAPISD